MRALRDLTRRANAMPATTNRKRAAPAQSREGNARITTEQGTRRVVIDAAIASILEQGFYRASSNEIARRAGVSWGVIQHHFGTREKLMLAVLEDGVNHFTETVNDVAVEADTAAERLAQLLDALAVHYADPRYLAYMQVALNMDHDPTTSAEVRATMNRVAERSAAKVETLVRAALGPAARVPDLVPTVFYSLMGFLVGRQLIEAMFHDPAVPGSDRSAQQRQLLTRMLAPFLEETASHKRRQR
jgi:AcrR family transcriptional regulator